MKNLLFPRLLTVILCTLLFSSTNLLAHSIEPDNVEIENSINDCDLDLISTAETECKEWQNVGDADFSAGTSLYQSLAFYNGEPYVAYSDGGNDDKVTLMKYDGSNWISIGSAGFSVGSSDFLNLAFYNGEPYVAYKDGGNSNKTTVMKYNGTNWVNVGSAGFSAGATGSQSLAFHNGEPYVAYRDVVNGSKTTVMKYDGANWVNVGNAGFSAGSAGNQSLAFYNGEPFVAYSDEGNGEKTTVMKFDGTNWVNVGNAGFSAGRAYYQSLAFYNGEPFVAYRDEGNGEKTTVMKYDGTNWVNVGNAGFSAGSSSDQCLVFYNNEPYVAYTDIGIDNETTVMKYNGSSWVNVGNARFSNGATYARCLAFHNGEPYVAFDDYPNTGTTVMKFTTFDNEPPTAICQDITVTLDENGTVNISAEDLDNGSNDDCGMVSLIIDINTFDCDNLGINIVTLTVEDQDGLIGTCTSTVTVEDNTTTEWQNVGDAGFSEGSATYQSLAFYNGEPYVAYSDFENGLKATVMKFDGTNWVNVGNAGFSAGTAYHQSLAFYNGEPYVAYRDAGNSNKTTVMKFDGSNWVNVGNAGFSAGLAFYQSLAFHNGEPYVAYQDDVNSNKTTVMKYDGTNWVNVGNAGFSDGSSGYQSLAFHNGEPYVAFNDGGSGGKTTVMKYDGTNWIYVGNAGFSAGVAYYQNLVFNNGESYVSYKDVGNGGKTTVMKFDGTNWVNVGNAGFSDGSSDYQSLAFYNGEPYVAFNDGGSGGKTTVMKYEGANWVNVGNAGISTGYSVHQSLAFYNGEPYVAYRGFGNGGATVMKFTTIDNEPPTAICQDITVTLNENGTASITAEDLDNGSNDICNEVSLSIDISTFTCEDLGTNIVTLSVEDQGGNISTCNSTVTIEDNQDPVFDNPSLADINVECSVTLDAPTATDNCAGSIMATTTDPTTYDIQGSYSVIWTYDDGNGNSVSQLQTINVVDVTYPVLTVACSYNITLCGPQNVSWTVPTATDNCYGLVLTTNHSPGDYFDVGTTTVTYNFTDIGGNVTSCSFDVTIHSLVDVTVSQSILPDFCQGLSVIEAIVNNEGDLAAPITYAWSDGLGNEAEATAFANGTYTVSVSDANGCETSISTTVDEVASDLLSGYVILSNKDFKMKRSTVSGGGIGVYDNNKKAKIEKNSVVNSFVKAASIQIKSGSTVANTIYDEADISLPDFVENDTDCDDEIKVEDGETMTITGNTYGKIKIEEDATLIIESDELYVKEIDMEEGAEIIFNQPTIVLVKKKVKMDKNASVNIGEEAVIFYIDDKLEVKEGGLFNAHVYAKKKIHAKKAKNNNQTYMTGTFISEDKIQSDDYVNWDWASFCNGDQEVADAEECDDDDDDDDDDFAAKYNNDAQSNDKEPKLDMNLMNQIMLLPNPTNGPFELSMGAYLGHQVEVNIYTFMGKKVGSVERLNLQEDELKFDLSNFVGSTYQIEIIIDGTIKTNQKLVVLRP